MGQLMRFRYSNHMPTAKSQQYFSHVRTGLPGLNQYLVEDRVSCSRTQDRFYAYAMLYVPKSHQLTHIMNTKLQ